MDGAGLIRLSSNAHGQGCVLIRLVRCGCKIFSPISLIASWPLHEDRQGWLSSEA